METSCVNLILKRLVDKVELDLKTNIPESDPIRARVVKRGLLQTNKVENIVQIGITGGDHEDPNYRDGIITLETMQNIGMHLPPREIGGGQYWWRRGIARVECFFIQQKYNEDEAHDAGYALLGRLMDSIDTVNPTGLVDDFGEGCIKIFCHSNTYFESGGPPNQFIFRGKVFWTALTFRKH